jgi:hypothetical protein
MDTATQMTQTLLTQGAELLAGMLWASYTALLTYFIAATLLCSTLGGIARRTRSARLR